MRDIHIHTAAFPTRPEGDLEFCNGQPGSAFVAWLRQQLAAHAIVCGEPIQEDYGWGCWIQENGCSIWVSVSHCTEDEGNAPASAEWVVSVAHSVPFFAFRQWFRRRQGAAAEAHIAGIIHAMLAARDDVTLAPSAAQFLVVSLDSGAAIAQDGGTATPACPLARSMAGAD